MKLLPFGYKRVDLVANSYRQVSIKSVTRGERGTSKKVILKSVKSKIPSDFKQFLGDGDNRNRMLDLIFEYVENRKAKSLNILRTSSLYLSKENGCRYITLTSVASVPEMIKNQEEADSRLILNAFHALQDDTNSQVVIKAISADTDISILALFHLYDFKERVILETGITANRKLMSIASYELSESHRYALMAFMPTLATIIILLFFKKGNQRAGKYLFKTLSLFKHLLVLVMSLIYLLNYFLFWKSKFANCIRGKGKI